MMQRKAKKKSRVVVGMSGGVDSSVSAALLQRDGFEVVGVFMKCWNIDDATGAACTAEEDEYWARRAAARLDIPFYSLDLVDEYKQRVVDYFIREYKAGRTPNPDIMCNNEIKFGVFFDKATHEFGADYVATGHYARIRKVKSQKSKVNPLAGGQNEKVKLLKGTDENKDQTYFLYRVPSERLAKVLFPVGEYPKPEVRKLAKKFGLPNAEKKDSQGLCFIGKVDLRTFLQHYIPHQEGALVTTDGRQIGTHNGAQFYTIGQRHGIGVGGGIPYYVVDKDIKTNTVMVGTQYDTRLFAPSLQIEDVRWINEQPRNGQKVEISIRYRQKPQKAVMYCVDGAAGIWRIEFREPQRAVTSGQSAVVYNGDEVLGGGIIV